MTPHFGYVRVSTVEQNEDRQLDGLDLTKTFIDKCSGKDRNRPELLRAIEHVREGDTLHVHSIDRLARNLQDLEAIVQELNAKGVTIQFHTEGLTFSGEENPIQQLMFQMMGAFSQFERSMIRERQREGIEAAKKRGAYKGRKKALDETQSAEVRSRAAKGESKAALAREFGVSRQTIYAILKAV